MPDIAMCNNITCKSKDNCYRFNAIPSEFRQSYGSFKPKENEDKCSYFIFQCEICKQINGNHKLSCSKCKTTI